VLVLANFGMHRGEKIKRQEILFICTLSAQTLMLFVFYLLAYIFISSSKSLKLDKSKTKNQKKNLDKLLKSKGR